MGPKMVEERMVHSQAQIAMSWHSPCYPVTPGIRLISLGHYRSLWLVSPPKG